VERRSGKVVRRTGGKGRRLGVGLLDEVAVDLVPVVMGGGRRFFGGLAIGDVPLGDPTVCVQGDRVTHLVFPAMRSGDPTQR